MTNIMTNSNEPTPPSSIKIPKRSLIRSVTFLRLYFFVSLIERTGILDNRNHIRNKIYGKACNFVN